MELTNYEIWCFFLSSQQKSLTKSNSSCIGECSKWVRVKEASPPPAKRKSCVLQQINEFKAVARKISQTQHTNVVFKVLDNLHSLAILSGALSIIHRPHGQQKGFLTGSNFSGNLPIFKLGKGQVLNWGKS